MVGLIRIADLDKDNLEDVFSVCSYNKLEDPLQREGMKLKRGWLIEMLEEYGPVTKIAYLDGRPVAQLLFYPEEAIPYIPHPREGAVRLTCVYNPFPEVRGKGVGTALLKSLVHDCEEGLASLRGRSCRFISALPFNTGEGTSMEKFYIRNGFRREDEELYLEINGRYEAPRKPDYVPLPEDQGRALVFYNRECEYSYPFAVRVKDLLQEIKEDLPVEIIDRWAHPEESVRRGNHQILVNAVPITSFWTQREEFTREVREALKINWSDL